MASVVFAEERRRERLDALMFSEIIGETERLISMYRRKPEGELNGILLDAPLLFEAGLDSRCDEVLLLTADMDVRIERVCRRDGVTADEVMSRISNQMSDEEKIKRADAVVDNSEGIEELFEKLQDFLTGFLAERS